MTRRLTGYRWVYISFFGFIISLASLFLILFFINSDPLNRFSGILFYIVLIPFGLVVAGFLFGALKSYAKASGKNMHGTLELGGPVVVFVLLLYGGVYFQNNFNKSSSFSLHLYFYGDQQKASKLNEGDVRIITNGSPVTRSLNSEGSISISLSSDQRGKKIMLDPFISGYKQNQIETKIPEESDVLDVILEPATYSTKVSGYVFDKEGQIPKGNLFLEWAGIKVPIDESGKYSLDLPYAIGTVKNLKIFQDSKMVYNIDQAIQEGQFDIRIPK